MPERQAKIRGLSASDAHVEGWNAQRRLSAGQRVGYLAAASGLLLLLAAFPALIDDLVRTVGWALISGIIVLRIAAMILARSPGPVAAAAWSSLPRYSVIAPMYREPHVCPQLIAHLNAFEYPRDRLEVLLTLEADDQETLAVLESSELPPGFKVFIAPPGAPKTKPRACNAALDAATGDLIVIYDAEDRPEPGQLLEAAARFAAEPGTACLQAPLRIDRVRGFLGAQFAFEYAAQFETLLPALHRLGAPFPLGGSSNHFRSEALRAVGGWDPHNVTEDADLAFRMAAAGMRSGLLATPTWEEPPHRLRDWTPQRARWIKGHLQTWLVHMRRPWAGGPARFCAIQLTLGLGLLSAGAHLPLGLLLTGELVLRATGWRDPALGADEAALVATCWAATLVHMLSAAQKAGVRLSWRHALQAPAYWPLHSCAAVWAVWQLVRAPFHWSKTEHRPMGDAGLEGP
jgi:hypothetical protein